jgi:hypothetical protein
MPKDERALPSPPSSPVPCPRTSPFPSLPGPRTQDFFWAVPSSTEGARIEAPRGVGCGEGDKYPSPLKNFCILNMKMVHF